MEAELPRRRRWQRQGHARGLGHRRQHVGRGLEGRPGRRGLELGVVVQVRSVERAARSSARRCRPRSGSRSRRPRGSRRLVAPRWPVRMATTMASSPSSTMARFAGRPARRPTSRRVPSRRRSWPRRPRRRSIGRRRNSSSPTTKTIRAAAEARHRPAPPLPSPSAMKKGQQRDERIASGDAKMQQLAQTFAHGDRTVVVEAYADANRGGAELRANDRANIIRNQLIDQGVAPARIKVETHIAAECARDRAPRRPGGNRRRPGAGQERHPGHGHRCERGARRGESLREPDADDRRARLERDGVDGAPARPTARSCTSTTPRASAATSTSRFARCAFATRQTRRSRPGPSRYMATNASSARA